MALNEQLQQHNFLLSERIRLILIEKYGSGAERLSDGQLSLLELEPSVCIGEVAAEAALDQKTKDLTPEPASKSAPARRKPVRALLPANLPREERIVCCPQGQCIQCGGPKKLIGYETSERLSIKPIEFFVEVTKREKLACAKCEEMGVSVAAVPPSIIEKGILSDDLVIDVIIKKYRDHSPLYRQAMSVERDTGVTMSQATLSASVIKAGALLSGVCAAMKARLLAGSYIQADETTVQVQSNRTKGKNHLAYLWQYSHPEGPVLYELRMGRDREGPEKFLSGYNGKLQSDAYAAYAKIGGPGIVHFGCWAHARRKFFDASKLDPKDAQSVAIVVKIGKLYAVEASAREGSLDAAARETLRTEISLPLLEEIKALVLEARSRALPRSALGKACTYALGQWTRLEAYAGPGNGEVEIDNNWAENGMRGVALGRKNWIHIGSESAGVKIAAILSILETCKRLKINTRKYLKDALPRLAYASTRPQEKLDPNDWTPSAWMERQKTAQA